MVPNRWGGSPECITTERLNYTGRNGSSLKGSAESGPLGVDAARTSLMRSAGRLPVVRLAAASSAFMGAASILGALVGGFQTYVGGDATPWVSAAPDGQVASRLTITEGLQWSRNLSLRQMRDVLSVGILLTVMSDKTRKLRVGILCC